MRARTRKACTKVTTLSMYISGLLYMYILSFLEDNDSSCACRKHGSVWCEELPSGVLVKMMDLRYDKMHKQMEAKELLYEDLGRYVESDYEVKACPTFRSRYSRFKQQLGL
jgi:hypothetical protein